MVRRKNITMNGIVSFRLCTLTDEKLVEKIDEITDKMYQTGELPTRHIPARPNSDYDLLVGELLLRFREKSDIKLEVKKLKPNVHIGDSLSEIII